MNETQKLKELIRQYGPTQAEFAKRLGVTQPTVANWLAQGRIPLSGQMRIASLVPLPSTQAEKTEGSAIEANGRFYSELAVSAGQVGLFEDDRSAEDVYVPGIKADAWFPVKGRSMQPTIEPGDIVGVRKIDHSQIRPGDIYLIFTRDTERMLKRIPTIDRASETITLHSDNPDYRPFEVLKSQICGVFKVVGLIRSLE